MALPTSLREHDLLECRSAHALFIDQKYEDALQKAEPLLEKHPDDIFVLSVVAESLMKLDRWGLAYILYRRLTDIEPTKWEFWNNLGRCLQQMVNPPDAMMAFSRALKIAPNEFAPYRNVAGMLVEAGRYDDATGWLTEAAKRARDHDDLKNIRRVMHRVHLAQRNWKEGWECFDEDLGTKYRPLRHYNGEPYWTGEPGKRVIIHGEQGIGDEIMFASMYGEAIARCKGVILDCDKRLEGLFRRSFPEAEKVYGTRHDRHQFWPSQDRADARISAGSLGRIFRASGEFPRRAYLTPDPLRRQGYRAILDSLPGRKIGIAWTGGTWITLTQERSVRLNQFRPLFDRPNLTFVSLQYRTPADLAAFEAETGIKIHHWPFAVQTKNYDDTAALVAELDAVVSVTTAVALLCGAIGKECHVLVPEHPTWHWATSGEMPWFSTLKLYRRQGRDWEPAVRQIAEAL